MREVTERDLRMPEFRDAKPEELEFRDDGKVVRKDRWEVTVRNIVSILGWSRREFELAEVVDEVRRRVEAAPERKPLKEEQIIDATEHISMDAPGCFIRIARAVEAAHGIGVGAVDDQVKAPSHTDGGAA